jgi:protein-export membrane protein SecD
MLQFSFSKIAFILAVVVASLLFALPNALPPSVTQHMPSWLKPVQLGLDLQGGSHLLLEVDTAAVLKDQLSDIEEQSRGALRDAKIRYRNIRSAEDSAYISLDPQDRPAARSAIAKVLTGLTIENVGDDRIRVTIPDTVKRARQIAAVSQSLEIIRRRIDAFGTSEPNIQREGSDRILVELPGVGDPTRVRNLIGKTAKLTFHLVEPGVTSLDDLPPGVQVLPDSHNPQIKYPVRRRVEVSGERLKDAQPTIGQNGDAEVSFRFDTAGGRQFATTTSNNVGQRLAIVLDDQVISAPTIKGPIVGGSGVIENMGTTNDAKDLSTLLRAGALPAPLTVIQESTVGPGLGADSIHAGGMAAIVGGLLVVGFMVLAYHTFGVFAVFGQVFHMVTLFAVLSLLGGTLTLPGIAGVVLSLGMAVDANVLIYERMREEFNSGRTLLNSLTAGFQNAFATIVDSNLTTFIAAAILYFLGSGPVQGFAVTLAIGIGTSMFSAVMVTRLQVWMWYRAGKRQTLPV